MIILWASPFPFFLKIGVTWDRFQEVGNLHCSNEIWKSIARGSHSSSLSSFRIKDGVPSGLSAFDAFMAFIALRRLSGVKPMLWSLLPGCESWS